MTTTKRFARIAAALALAAGPATAATGDFSLVVDAERPLDSEDSAVIGYVLLHPAAQRSRAVGAVGRAYSASSGPGNTAWGVVTEAVNLPTARGHLIGLETAVANMAHDNASQLRGIDVVFKNRWDTDLNHAVAAVGLNRYNENSTALYVSSQPRSPAGEYSGWQSGIRFAPSSLDRSASRPYVAAMDVSEVEVEAPLYLIVWRCGEVKCGLAPVPGGARIVVDVENVAR